MRSPGGCRDCFSLEMWGGATFDTTMRFLNERPVERLRQLRARIPNICFPKCSFVARMPWVIPIILKTSSLVLLKHAAASGMDIFRIFDSLNLHAESCAWRWMQVQGTHAICEAAVCYTGDILDPNRAKYSLKYYVQACKRNLRKMGAHMIAIKDMAGLLPSARCQGFGKGITKMKLGIPIHFQHARTRRARNLPPFYKASEAGVDIVDLALASMSGSTSQPNLNSIVAALQQHAARHGTRSRRVERVL